MEDIQAIVKAITAKCGSYGCDVSETLAAFVARTVNYMRFECSSHHQERKDIWAMIYRLWFNIHTPMYAIVTPILKLVHKYCHDDWYMTFYTTHLVSRLLLTRVRASDFSVFLDTICPCYSNHVAHVWYMYWYFVCLGSHESSWTNKRLIEFVVSQFAVSKLP